MKRQATRAPARVTAALRAFAASLVVLHAPSAIAAAQRSFVSTGGTDNPSCSLAAPCRTFDAAIAASNPGGEVVVLDSGGYGGVTITKSISITSPAGVYAGVSQLATGTAMTIEAGASDIVVLRGLTITGPGAPAVIATGITVLSAGTVHLESVVVSGFGTSGLNVNAATNVFIKDSIFRNNGGGAVFSAPSGTADVSVDRSRFEANGVPGGLVAADNSRVAVRDSVFSGNGQRGLRAATLGGPAELDIESCLISFNGEGVLSGSTFNDAATVRLSNNTITDNVTGVRFINGNLLLSGGGNTIRGNTTDGTLSGNYVKQ
jgi:hypothetical protein